MENLLKMFHAFREENHGLGKRNERKKGDNARIDTKHKQQTDKEGK